MSLVAKINIKSLEPPRHAKKNVSILVRATQNGTYWLDPSPLNPKDLCKISFSYTNFHVTWRQVLCL